MREPRRAARRSTPCWPRSSGARWRPSARSTPHTLVYYEPNVLFNNGAPTPPWAARATPTPASPSTTTAWRPARRGHDDRQLRPVRRHWSSPTRPVTSPPTGATPNLLTEFGATDDADDPRRRWRRAPTATSSAGRNGTTAAARTRRRPGRATPRRSCSTRASRRPARTSRRRSSPCCRGPTRRSWPGPPQSFGFDPDAPSASTCATSRPAPAAARSAERRADRGGAARAPVSARVRRRRRGRLGPVACRGRARWSWPRAPACATSA